MEGNLGQSELLEFIYGYFLMNEFHCEYDLIAKNTEFWGMKQKHPI